ncbi:MAG: hypothetical protein QXY22_06055 [Candidatus Nitrosotenuis sp.]|jgi:hypothetical protein|uniref:Uncharacterized protein n=1 Tax=Candidatus Nitrosotenuis uzonensis TaxID=1407055 RepID=V6AR09_9ARCH|nr:MULTISPECIES: hypothetical protein [Nitrosotenuis]MCA2003168.1 hypothetical protein [Candidatus Nitrosotenuis sp.]CAE6493668.1 conserved hypothetical protein [Candidatus Nitrosotenuis uzonensis]CDI05141.1 conserved hypothetical protein [Candidatus Nitrosotenuis uzonensis]
MGRTFDQWWNSIPADLRSKVRAGDEGNKPLLNQINWVWVKNLMDKRADLNPTAAELLDWVTSGQIDAMRK